MSRPFPLTLAAAFLLALLLLEVEAVAQEPRTLAIAVHGGAGVISRNEMTSEREARYRAALEAARDAGYAVLERGGSSLEAVTVAVRMLEDEPLFNAGRGAVLTHEGIAELDASIMDGRDLRAGAVAGVRHVKNPIELARAVMEKSPHVFLAGAGAEEFALQQGLTLVPNDYFRTEAREKQLEKAIQEEKRSRKPAPSSGTVGAVAIDAQGNLAAATSTGGMTNKRNGRVGDSPIIGAGTYANNASCAVSSTGHGEFFIRAVVAHDICARVEYRQLPLETAVREVIHGTLVRLGGEGGVIAVDREGNIVMDFNSNGMFRAVRDSRGRREVAIYRSAEDR
ncbi:MAG TPA: isoaspartyl peptidase/L-asparaginase [Steroidobacteraceae bacterium]